MKQNFHSRTRAFGLSVTLLASLLSCHSVETENPYSENYQQMRKTEHDNWLKNKYEKLRSTDKIDPYAGLTRDDYKKGLTEKTGQSLNRKDEGGKFELPGMQQLISEPEEPKLINDKLVSISVTEDVPIKDVLIELARRADVDIEIDPAIEGGVILRIKDRPFSEVIERISSLAGLTYQAKNGVLRVEKDVPLIRNYRMNLLNIIRTSNSTVQVSTDLLGSNSGGSGGGFSSGSNSTLSSVSAEGDIWATVEAGISNILRQYSPIKALKVAVEEQPAAAPAPEQDPRARDNRRAPAAAAPQANNGRSSGGDTSQSSVLSVNRQAGIIAILATNRQHRAIKDYLDQVQVAHSSQVLIEAKILEVALDDDYRTGINWNFLNDNRVGVTATTNFNDTGLDGTDASQLFTLGVLPSELFGIRNTSLDASIDLVQRFGTTRTLSSPRLHAMNNQYAVLTFAENFVYFEIDVEEETQQTSSGEDTRITATSEIKTIPIGVILAIQPSIDLERSEIVMNVRPTLSRITGTVEDPAVALSVSRLNQESGSSGGNNIRSEIPVVEIRELDSILRMKSGEVMVIGGLMEERSENTDRGIPGVSEVPVFGNAFKSVVKNTQTVETVIFIKATIVPGQGVTVEDENFYHKFSGGKPSM